MSTITLAFEPLYGKLAWNVHKGIGSFLCFEFGEPHLSIIRQPVKDSKSASPRLKRHQARRIVCIRGDWHLWIYCCDWQFFSDETLVGSSDSSKKVIREAAADLDGQALTYVEVKPTGETIFHFDLGGHLSTTPALVDYAEKETSIQWLLFEPAGTVFMLRADGQYCHERSDSLENENWRFP